MFATATFSTLAPIYARDELGVGAEGYGAFLGAAGAGALTAALLVTTFAHGDRRPWLIVGVLGMAGLVGGIALARSVGIVFASPSCSARPRSRWPRTRWSRSIRRRRTCCAAA